MNGSVTYEGLILQGGINVDTGANLEELTVYENGVYNPSTGKDGFSKVTVEVPAAVLDDITITENGHYTPPIGVDGYDDITVSVPHPTPVLDDITITENGSYQPPTGVDGYNDITVNVPAPAPVLDDITITANGHYTPPTGTDGYDDITVNVPLPTNGIYKQTLSGLPSPIATFNGADAPIDSLKASIVGVQDLHGYDHPWVGGAWKNKLEVMATTREINGVTFTVNSDGSVTANGTATAEAQFTIPIDTSMVYGDLYFVGCSGGSNSTYNVYMWDNTTNSRVKKWDGTTASAISIDGTFQQVKVVQGNTVNMALRIASGQTVNNVTFYPMICLSTETDPTFAPYSNICPISGWTSCEVTDNNDTYTIPFKDSSDNPITVYDGEIDISGGKLTITHANIASYNGEAINEPWMSSEDVYTQGATPTTGAQVVYPLTTPLVYEFNPLALRSDGVTNISVDCGEVTEVKYYSNLP